MSLLCLTMESLTTRISLFFALVSIVSAGGLHLDFGVKLPPFVLHMPRFNLPPIKIAATFKPSTGSSPFAIRFPGISISSNQGQDSWWDQNKAWPEPEHEPYPESEPEPEPEPESEPEPEPEYHQPSHHGNYHSYDPWSKTSVKPFPHKDSWSSRARSTERNKPLHGYLKQQSSMVKSPLISTSQHETRQKSIVNAHMAAIRSSGSRPSPSSSSHSTSISPTSSSSSSSSSQPTSSEIESWLSQMKSINSIPDQFELSNPIDFERRRSSNAHHLNRASYKPPIKPQSSSKLDQTSLSSATIDNENDVNSEQSLERGHESKSNGHK